MFCRLYDPTFQQRRREIVFEFKWLFEKFTFCFLQKPRGYLLGVSFVVLADASQPVLLVIVKWFDFVIWVFWRKLNYYATRNWIAGNWFRIGEMGKQYVCRVELFLQLFTLWRLIDMSLWDGCHAPVSACGGDWGEMIISISMSIWYIPTYWLGMGRFTQMTIRSKSWPVAIPLPSLIACTWCIPILQVSKPICNFTSPDPLLALRRFDIVSILTWNQYATYITGRLKFVTCTLSIYDGNFG